MMQMGTIASSSMIECFCLAGNAPLPPLLFHNPTYRYRALPLRSHPHPRPTAATTRTLQTPPPRFRLTVASGGCLPLPSNSSSNSSSSSSSSTQRQMQCHPLASSSPLHLLESVGYYLLRAAGVKPAGGAKRKNNVTEEGGAWRRGPEGDGVGASERGNSGSIIARFLWTLWFYSRCCPAATSRQGHLDPRRRARVGSMAWVKCKIR